MAKFLKVRNWEQFQHYKDRSAPWVKLYRDLLTSESWVLGTDTSRLVQVASILLAVRYENLIPLNWALLKRVSSLDCSEKQFFDAVQHLSKDFLEIQEVTERTGEVVQIASNVLATCTSEERREEERREEQIASNVLARNTNGKHRKASNTVPDDFVPDLAFATSLASDMDAEAEAQKFRDWEFKTPHHDWNRAWKRWARNAVERGNYARKTKPGAIQWQ